MFRKTNICITKYDYGCLIKLLRNSASYSSKDRNSTSIKKLYREIRRAKKVDSRKIPSDYVTMNSVFELKDIGKPGKLKFKLVFPHEADIENGKLSVLAPAGTEVFGSRRGDVIKWSMPSDEKYYQINKIIYQPEANGDYYL